MQLLPNDAQFQLVIKKQYIQEDIKINKHLSLPVALAHVFFYRCDAHFAVLFVLLVSVGGKGGGRKHGNILEGICSSTLTSPVNLKFLLTRDTSNMKTISIHVILAVVQWC